MSYTVDGGAPVDLSAQLDLPQDGPTDLPLAFELPEVARHRFATEVCLTVTGKDSGGTSSETTCSDLVTVTGEVSYSWRQVGQDGPPVFLSSRTGANPTFVAPDDGRYVFELTVTDGTGGTATDRVVVEVTNVDPTLELSHGDSFAGGVTQVNATLTDEGWLDTHSATVAWGDGTTDQVPVTTAGPGWGTFFGSHVYRTAGSFDIVVTLTDDDGGTRTARVDKIEVASPVAVWANSTASRSLDWGGGSGEIQGRVHTNGELRFVGASKTVKGPTDVRRVARRPTRPEQLRAAADHGPASQDFPFRPQVADFRPGGPVAAEVGTAYHDMTSACAERQLARGAVDAALRRLLRAAATSSSTARRSAVASRSSARGSIKIAGSQAGVRALPRRSAAPRRAPRARRPSTWPPLVEVPRRRVRRLGTDQHLRRHQPLLLRHPRRHGQHHRHRRRRARRRLRSSRPHGLRSRRRAAT